MEDFKENRVTIS